VSPEEFRRYGHMLIDWLADYHEGLSKRPVMAKTKPGETRDALPAPVHLQTVCVRHEPSCTISRASLRRVFARRRQWRNR
jgi:hypothetical protein